MKVPAWTVGAALVWCGAACNEPEADLLVFAAASLQDVCYALESDFEAAHDVSVDFHFAGSNELCRQLIASERGDVFLSADELQMERLAAAGRIRTETRFDLLSNELVVVVHDDGAQVANAAELARFERIALADPRIVPAGRYARAWLEAQGVWESVADKVVPAIDVRAALAMVASGAVPVGIVYATDAARSERVVVALRIEQGPPIRYPVAALKESSELVEPFLAFLCSNAARARFEEHGFDVLETP